jgi:lipopolysaccharide heptosyltransferase II
MSWNDVRNLLCVRLDSIGDVLMTTPAIRACKETFGCRITLLTSKAGACAAQHVPEIDEVLVFAAPWMKVATPDPEEKIFAELTGRRFDAAAIFTVYSQSPLPAAYLCYRAGIPRRLAHCHENPYHLLSDWQPDPEPTQRVRHEVQRQLDLVAAIGARTTDERLSFAVPASARERAQEFLCRFHGPTVVVHVGASAASRRYPPEQYARAVDMLIEHTGCNAIFTGEAGEEALVRTVREAMSLPSHSLVARLELAELAALIAEADLLISNNTGPAHIAAAVGTPVVDLYALTNLQHTPWRVKSRVLFHDVPCRNCHKSVCPAGHHDCLKRVPPEQVASAAMELLA